MPPGFFFQPSGGFSSRAVRAVYYANLAAARGRCMLSKWTATTASDTESNTGTTERADSHVSSLGYPPSFFSFISGVLCLLTSGLRVLEDLRRSQICSSNCKHQGCFVALFSVGGEFKATRTWSTSQEEILVVVCSFLRGEV